jgi:hypothetical protein
LAHEVLYKAQEDQGSPLAFDLAKARLQMTPGLAFAPGTTFDDVFERLQNWRLIEITGSQIRILKW